MKDITIGTVTEILIYSAISALLAIIAMFVTPLMPICAFVCGIPLALLVCKRGIIPGIVGSVCTIITLCLLTANLVTVLMIFCFYAPPSILFGILAWKNTKFSASVFSVASIYLIGLVLQLMFINGNGNGIQDLLHASVDTTADSIKSVLVQITQAGGLDADIDKLVAEAANTIVNAIITYMPTILIVLSIVSGYAISAINIFLLKRLNIKKVQYTRFNMIKIPEATVAVFVLSFLIISLSKRGEILVSAMQNIYLISSLAISLSGFSFVDYILSRKIRSGYIRTIIYASVFIFGFMFVPFITEVFFVVGIFAGSAIRNRFKGSGKGNGEKK